jgi:DNA-binding CsgD family transcriptional regulator
VAAADPTVLHALSERALIRTLTAPSSRFGMDEQIRQYAAEMRDDARAGAADVTRRAHLDHVLGLYERALVDVDSARARRWTPRLRLELPNAGAALDWALETGLAELALRMTAALAPIWVGLSGMGAHLSRFEAALDLPWDGASRPTVVARARVLDAAGFAAMQVDSRRALRHFREEVALYDQLGDELNRARALSNCGFATRVDDPETALRYLRHGLGICERAGTPLGVAWLRLDLGEGLFVAGRDEEAEPLVLDGRRRLRVLGVSYGVVVGSLILGHAYRRQHRWREGLRAYATAAEWQQRELIGTHGADVLIGLAAIAVAVDRPDHAAWLFGAGRAWEERWGTRSLLDPRRELDAYRRSVPARLADPDWSARYEEGKRLTWDAALQRVPTEVEELLSGLAAPAHGLTVRELQILRLVAEGLSDIDVAAELGVSPRTVHHHLYLTYRKLAVGSRVAAVNATRRLGLLEAR